MICFFKHALELLLQLLGWKSSTSYWKFLSYEYSNWNKIRVSKQTLQESLPQTVECKKIVLRSQASIHQELCLRLGYAIIISKHQERFRPEHSRTTSIQIHNTVHEFVTEQRGGNELSNPQSNSNIKHLHASKERFVWFIDSEHLKPSTNFPATTQ